MIFIIVLIILIMFAVYVGALFYPILLHLLYNLPILYLIYLFSHNDLWVERNYYEYGTSTIITALLFVFAPEFFLKLPIWPVTSFILVVLLIAKLGIYIGLKEMIIKEQPTEQKKTGLRKFEYGYLKPIKKTRRKKH